MKEFWSFVKLFVLASVGVAGILATTPLPLPYFAIITANNEELYAHPIDEEAVFACLDEKVKLDWSIPDTSSVTLTATPSGNLNPDLNKQKAESYGTLETVALGDVVVTLEAGDLKIDVALKLLPQEVCTGFPINLIANFEGELRQTLPETASLKRQLELRWRGNALQARIADTVTNEDGYITASLTNCQLFPDEDELICSAGDEANPRLRLEGTITAEGFAGSYQGFDESTGSAISFEGTFDFKKVQ
jgi:hypothetical protein